MPVLNRRRVTRVVLALLALLGIAFLVRALFGRRRRQPPSLEKDDSGRTPVSSDICSKRKTKDGKDAKKWYNPNSTNPEAKYKCYDEANCNKRFNGKGRVEKGNCVNGLGGAPTTGWLNNPTQGGKGGCAWNQVKSGDACVPVEVESPEIGGTGGSFEWKECPATAWVSNIRAAYDDSNRELKNMSVTCSDATQLFDKKGLGGNYQAESWQDPDKPGWVDVGYVTGCCGRKDNRLRAFGPAWNDMVGASRRSDFNASTDNKFWTCESAGKAPPGKRWAITGMGIGSGDAIDRIKVKCKMFDIQK